MRRAPKLWRRKKGGKFVGNWFVTIKDVPVNLGTKDASAASARRSDALNGARKFADDVDAAASETAAALNPAPAVVLPPAPVELPPAPAPPLEDDDDGDDDAPEIEEAGEAARASEDWSETVGAAAGEAESASEPGAPVAPVAEFNLSIEQVMKILGLPAKELAPLAVEVQLKAHEAIAGVFGFDELNPIPESSRGRAVLTVGYVPVIELLQADKIPHQPGVVHPRGLAHAGARAVQGRQAQCEEKGRCPGGAVSDRCPCCGFTEGVPDAPHRYERVPPGMARCAMHACGAIGPAEHYSKAGRCPRCERGWQAARHRKKLRLYSGVRRGRSLRVLKRLRKPGHRSRSAKARASES